MKVLIISKWYPNRNNPIAGIYVRDQAKILQTTNEILVLHLDEFSHKSKYVLEKEEDIDLTEGIPTYRILNPFSTLSKIGSITNLIGAIKAYSFITKEIGFTPDVLHAHTDLAGTAAVLIGKIYKIPVVITEHNTAYPRKLLRGTGLLRARLTLESANIVLPVSTALKGAIEDYGIKAKFQVVPNVVDTSLFTPTVETKKNNITHRLISVSLFDRSNKKGIPYLLEALSSLNNIRSDWIMDFVGDGPRREEYENMVAKMKLCERVTFHGLKSKKDVANIMKQCDLFILPSLYETFSIATAEALSCGIPVVATMCGGPEEYINDRVGALVPPGDSAALFKMINRTLDDLDKFDKCHISHYARERFSPEIVRKTIDLVYKDIIG
jgi:glycosyltransferase involved in cell wall biosynthesis